MGFDDCKEVLEAIADFMEKAKSWNVIKFMSAIATCIDEYHAEHPDIQSQDIARMVNTAVIAVNQAYGEYTRGLCPA